MSLPSSPGGQPTLLEYFERSQLQPSALGSASATQHLVLCSAESFEVRPLFDIPRSDSSATHSETRSSRSQPLNQDAETPESSISDAEERNSKLAGELLERIDAHIEDTEEPTQCGGMTGSLADLMIAEIAAEIDALRSDNGDGEARDVTSAGEISYEIEVSKPTMTDASARIQLFESSYEYFFYARDRSFHDQFSRRHPRLPLVRAEGRMKAFERTEAWSRYLEDLQVVVVGHETMQELQSGAARQAGDRKVRESAAVEDDSEHADGNRGKSKERVKGQLSKQWRDLGVEKRPISSTSGFGAW